MLDRVINELQREILSCVTVQVFNRHCLTRARIYNNAADVPRGTHD